MSLCIPFSLFQRRKPLYFQILSHGLVHYTAKSIHSPIKISEISCSNHFHGHRCIKESTQACRHSTDICERMGRSQELSGFQCGTVIGCHLCNKSSREMSSLLNIPQSTVSGITTKWKRLGMAVPQPWSGRPRKMTRRGQRMLRRIVLRGRQLSAESIATDL